MQQKRVGYNPVVLLLGFLGAIVLALIVLMMRDIPAPQHVIEKPLDPKAFLEQKQP